MARATGKDHARVHLDIWGNDDWLDLSPAAQHLYFVLWTSPQLSYCGAGDWHPGKLASKAHGWTAAMVERAAVELSEGLFLIIDTDTGEYLLRSWVKHDGLWNQPNLAVSMANARADLASRTLRGIVVFEVLKIRERDLKSEKPATSWARDAVAKMLEQKPIDPAALPPFNPGGNPDISPTVYPYGDPAAKGKPNPSADPGADPGPTPAPAPAPAPTSKKDDDVDNADQVPDYIENPARPTKRQPTSAAMTVVRQELGNIGYARSTVEQLAVQVDKLYADKHPDTRIREALREYPHRTNAIPSWLPGILSDIVQRETARSAPAKTPPSKRKVNAALELAQKFAAQQPADQPALES